MHICLLEEETVIFPSGLLVLLGKGGASWVYWMYMCDCTCVLGCQLPTFSSSVAQWGPRLSHRWAWAILSSGAQVPTTHQGQHGADLPSLGASGHCSLVPAGELPILCPPPAQCGLVHSIQVTAFAGKVVYGPGLEGLSSYVAIAPWGRGCCKARWGLLIFRGGREGGVSSSKLGPAKCRTLTCTYSLLTVNPCGRPCYPHFAKRGA